MKIYLIVARNYSSSCDDDQDNIICACASEEEAQGICANLKELYNYRNAFSDIVRALPHNARPLKHPERPIPPANLSSSKNAAQKHMLAIEDWKKEYMREQENNKVLVMEREVLNNKFVEESYNPPEHLLVLDKISMFSKYDYHHYYDRYEFSYYDIEMITK